MTIATADDTLRAPRIERVRHELKVRSVEVAGVETVTPSMLRILFRDESLADFTSLGFDDHVKIFVPTEGGVIERRDYTPRWHDAASRTLAIDFALHEAGPATRWALEARPGDRIEIAGPRGSAVVSDDVSRWVLVGDETALPAIGRRIETAPSGAQIVSVVAVTGPAEEQTFDARATLDARWAHRPASEAADPAALLAALSEVAIEPGTFVWIAAEARVARALRDHVTLVRGRPMSWLKAAGYWVQGKADAREKFEGAA